MSAAFTQRAIDHLWPDGDSLTGPQVYAVLDGARDPRIEPLVRLGGLEYACLYAGPLSPSLRAAAPCLIHLAPGSRCTRQLIELGWGDSWGMFLVAPGDVTLQALRRHFRTLLRVEDESGRKLVFRFYDPRVLRIYLPTCTEDEAAQFFGPVHRIVVEADEPARAATYARGGSGVTVETTALAGA